MVRIYDCHSVSNKEIIFQLDYSKGAKPQELKSIIRLLIRSALTDNLLFVRCFNLVDHKKVMTVHMVYLSNT
jgi:hypothetical protein